MADNTGNDRAACQLDIQCLKLQGCKTLYFEQYHTGYNISQKLTANIYRENHEICAFIVMIRNKTVAEKQEGKGPKFIGYKTIN